MQILGLQGMYFDAVVVEFKTFFYFDSNWLWPFCGKFQFKNEVNLWDHPFIKIKIWGFLNIG